MRTIRPLAIALSVAALAACGGHTMHETPNAFSWTDQLPAGATLHLRDLTGSIHVVPTTDASVRVRGSKSWRGREPDVRFITNRRGDDMYVCAVFGSSGRCDEHGYRSRSGRSGIMGFLSIFSLRKTRRGDATVNFEVALPPGVKLDASTVMGDVSAEGLAAGSSLKTVNGDVRMTGTGAISGKSTNGDVTVSVATLGAADTISAESVNGEVEVTVPGSYEGALQIKTVNGDVSSDFPITVSGSRGMRNIVTTIGSAPRLVKLSTVNGEVRVKKS